jgi:hypothetical protein
MEGRSNPRIPVGPQCRARLRLEQGPLYNLPVVNLGTGGCCLDVPAPLASALLGRAFVGDLELVHPSLPARPLKGQIAWVHSVKQAGGDTMAIGVEFTEAPGGFARDLAGLVARWAEYERRNPGFDGMPA